MINKRKENSVKSLTELYTVVIGVALSLAVASLIKQEVGLASITAPSAFLFFAFVVTLFPFYHGALRHLDDAYVENKSDHIKDGALIFDFLLLFFHGLVFVVLSQLISKPIDFACAITGLLLVDVVWGAFAYFASSSKNDFAAEGKWTIINLIFVLIAACYLYPNGLYPGSDVTEPKGIAIYVAAACLIRSLVDYIWGSKFYFPPD
jgi:hypothetical protein